MRNQLRAILVSLHLFAVILMSIPGPAALTEDMLQEENLQANFRDWSALAQNLGVDLEPEDIEALSFTWGRRVFDLRATALEPFRPYYKYMGTRQRWQMFGVLNRRPGRIEIATCDGPETEDEPRNTSLGIQFRATSSGAEITEVLSDGPANWGGLQVGDVLTHINGTSLRSLNFGEMAPLFVDQNRSWMRLRLARQEDGRSRNKNVNIILCEDEDWQHRFIMGSNEANWRRASMDQERFRAIISSFAWKQREGHYTAFSRWLVGEVQVDFPNAQALGVRMARLDIPEPEDLDASGAIPC